jgi:hypothetical protein
MGTAASAVPSARDACGRHGAWAVVRVLWKLLSFPVLALLIILEPVVQLLLAGLALLLTLMAFFWRLAAPPGLHVPFIGMLGAAVGCISVLAVYYWVLRVLST